jgi:HK97 family phage prohead protease
MPIVSDREYRNMMPLSALEGAEAESAPYRVRGYASTFERYLLWDYDGVQYYEEIAPTAFDAADMSDVILQYDHEGRVFARQSNGSLKLHIDDHGLGIEADLGRTSSARALYEDIAAGLITRMSFAFTVAEDSYDKDTHTRRITRIKKVYDVSAVSIPANPGTDISARSWLDGVIEAEKAERLRAENEARARAKLALKLKLM